MEIVVILEDHKPTMSLLNAGTVDANDVIAECRVMLDIIRYSDSINATAGTSTYYSDQ